MDSPARERILGRLRRAVGGESPAPESVCAPVVPMSREEKIARLKRLMEAVRSEVHVVERGGWTETLRSVLRAHGAKSLLYAPGTWVGKAVDAVRAGGGEGFPEAVPYDGPVESLKETVFRVDAAVTTTRGAIAETGALVLWPDADEPRLMSLVPPVHVAVLEADRIYASFCEIIQAEGWAGRMPTNAVLVSGPSKTADIEMTLAFGVHGPKALVVILVDG